MKKMVIRNVQVVGMHHYGRRELDLMGTYHIELEPQNPYDPHAVAVYDGPRKVGNLKRDNANAIHEIVSVNMAKSKYFLRPLDFANVRNRRLGPQQSCAITFKLEESDVDELVAKVMKHSATGLFVKVMDLGRKN